MIVTTWIPEQRVVNEAEPDLGIGTIVRLVDHRTVEVRFEAADLTRHYNVGTAPLRRLVLARGQQAVGRTGLRFKITDVREQQGLLLYVGDKQQMHERDLAHQIAAAHAVDQLLAGQLSPHGDYALRRDGWKLRQQALASETRGLTGARVRLLPHQLYIASRIAHQEIPRVLLADEVGLGKTIEAGLIFCTLRALGRADRVLIATPQTLIHQWLAELYRRFNDMFTVLDEDRCEEMEEDDLSPFHQTPHVLCSLEFLAHHPHRLVQAAEAGWDLLMVDEAHHLSWEPRRPSPLYRAVEVLAARSRGLLLLTATPLRSGYATEFGLLRLVDPDRFSSFSAFKTELSHLRRLAGVARSLADGTFDTAAVESDLMTAYPDDVTLPPMLQALRDGGADAVPELLSELIDRHGTGRVLMRNRRARLHGFPKRVLHGVPMSSPEARIEWLVEFLRADAERKVLLIASDSASVTTLQEKLRESTATSTALFHDGLSIVERDRQAAWFSEPDGARVLLSSEIGGEGRNFQFAHHLILWDLPVDPDVLEQRIGRLDRIGQTHDVHIHAMYVEDSESQAIFEWHRHGLNSFVQPVSGAEQVMMTLEEQVDEVLDAYRSASPTRQEALQALLDRTRQRMEEVQRDIQENIDTLVDLNSFDPQRGEVLVREVQAVDEDEELAWYMSRVFERFGVTEEELDDRGRLHIRPSDLMFVEVFPGLPQDGGLGATYRRDVALEREDLAFLTRDHPLVEGALGLMLDENTGRASVCAFPDTVDKGIVIQFLFILEATGPAALELTRYLPPTPLEVALDATLMPAEQLVRRLSHQEHRFVRVGHEGFSRYAAWLHEQFPPIVAAAEKRVAEEAGRLQRAALATARASLQAEQERLEGLRRINPTVSQAEVAAHKAKMGRVLKALSGATPRLDALRVIALPGKSA